MGSHREGGKHHVLAECFQGRHSGARPTKEAESPESITTGLDVPRPSKAWGYGFRARLRFRFGAPE